MRQRWMFSAAGIMMAAAVGLSARQLQTPADVVFSANGKEITKVLRSEVSPDGQVGFRVGSGVNLHTSQLSVTYKLAPVRK